MHQFDLRVYYEDTDMAGIVYYANYLRYIERARSDWVRDLGIDQNEMRKKGQVFAVRRIEADYLCPAHFDDVLQVETSVQKVTGARLLLEQWVNRDETPLFKALVTIVCLGQDGKPVRLAANFRQFQP